MSKKTLFSGLILGLFIMALMPVVASAQTVRGQLVVVTKTASGVSVPSGVLVKVVGTGPSLSSVTSNSSTLTYYSSFNNDTQVVTVIPGTYAITVPSFSNYSFSYSGECTGMVANNEIRTCTITAYAGTNTSGNARVNVTVNVINNNGGMRNAQDFLMTVSGQNTSINTFQGSTGQVQVSLNSGSYSIDGQTSSNYVVNRSSDCTGTINSGDTRNCFITFDDIGSGNYNPYYPTYNRLTCSPSNQQARIGDTISFSAIGGSGTYTWATADRTYLNTGASLNVLLSSLGRQAVYVTSGYETASCMVDVYDRGSVISGGIVKGVYTQAPGLPNTGFGPSALGMILALVAAFVAFPLAVLFSFPYVKRTTYSLFK